MLKNDDLVYAFTLTPKDAVKFFRSKGYVIGWNWQDVAAETHAQAFTVAKAARVDILETLGKELDKAIATGTTSHEFVKTLTPRLQKLGWWGKQVIVDSKGEAEMVQLGSPWRLKNIYRINTQTAYQAGRIQQQTAMAESRPYWMYVAVMDENTRASHAALHNKVFHYTDPIWNTHYPANGWGCRCRVRALSLRRLQSLGLQVESSEGRLSTHTVESGFDKRSGEVYTHQVTTFTQGGQSMTPDAGWNHRPGKPQLKQFNKDVIKKEKRLVNSPREKMPGLAIKAPAPFSTVKGVSGDQVNRVLNELGTGQSQKLFNDFLAAHPIKSVMAKATELSGKKALQNRDMQTRVADYLSVQPQEAFRQYAYSTRASVSRTNGYTRASNDLVMVKVAANTNLAKVEADKIKQATNMVLEAAAKNSGPRRIYAPDTDVNRTSTPGDYINRYWSLSDAAGQKSPEQIVTTWIHEVGHQVHYWAGSPSFPALSRVSVLTEYSRTNKYEWFAEHFTAWYIDPIGVRKWNPKAADFIEATMKEAIENSNPTLKGR
ncbi:phage minor head protein [Endozoicomonas numazuensis]|uniref:phage minor head protein n=1 Tax=Endozoicomonas numazuensis TaxID=1137799 RepID=UPI0006914335|nr:phage minor head protein [Endozoicomonas numazuensis]